MEREGEKRMADVKLSIRIDKELRDEFKRIAEENAQTPSALVRKWVNEYIEKNKRKK